MQIITNQFQKELKEHGNYQFPFLVSYERLSRYETGSFLWHWHPEIEITLITHGEMVYHCNDRIFYPQKNDIIFCNSNALHAGERCPDRPMDADTAAPDASDLTQTAPESSVSSAVTGRLQQYQDCAYTSITFDARLIYGYDQSLIHQKYVQPVLQNSALSGLHLQPSDPWYPACFSLLQEIIALSESHAPLYELELPGLLLKFWKLLCENSGTMDTVSSADRLNHTRIRKILEYIAEHYSRKIYLEDVAAHIGLCKSECCRLFKRYMKVSLFEFLLEYRIERSLDALADPSLGITEVAGLAGFNDSNYYSKAFGKIKGCSPRTYRRRLLTDE